MKRTLIFAAVFVGCCVFGGLAEASITVNGTFTVDNVSAALLKDGSSPVDVTSYITTATNRPYDWENTKTITNLVLPSEVGKATYELIFRVYNNVGEGQNDSNPAGFLADLTLTGDSSGERLSDTTDWQYAVDTGMGTGALPNFNTLTWSNATAWPWEGSSPDNGGSNIWSSVNGGPISGISTNAQWIWSGHNGADLSGGNYDENWLWIKTDIDVPSSSGAVPEPATMIVWSLLGAASWLGMRVWRGGQRISRRSWSSENRQAIHEIIARGTHC
jgi:hypothetical protein